MTSLLRSTTSSSLLARLIESPDLPDVVRAMPAPTFAALVRRVGVEDAGEIVSLATTEQLVAAFDEDLFVGARAGEREAFDVTRFVAWLEVLLEAGDRRAAARVAELSVDFVAYALGHVMTVLDNDTLLLRMAEGGDDAHAVDKAIESCLSEEMDGYLLVSRIHDGWDAALSIVLALDREHRAFLERVLDRCADASSSYLDDLEALAGVLSEAESLAEDVEAEREARRDVLGYVEPRAAKSFLTLARRPAEPEAEDVRDPITRAYFRDAERRAIVAAPRRETKGPALLGAVYDAIADDAGATPHAGSDRAPLLEALAALAESDQALLVKRTDELAYLANVLLSGAEIEGRRFTPAEAAEAALATVELGARIRIGQGNLVDVVRTTPMDMLFRTASSALAALPRAPGLVRSSSEVPKMFERLGKKRSKRG